MILEALKGAWNAATQFDARSDLSRELLSKQRPLTDEETTALLRDAHDNIRGIGRTTEEIVAEAQQPAQVPATEHTLNSIVATQAAGTVEEWERQRDEHNAKVVRERARREGLLAIELANMPALADHAEPPPVLRMAGLEMPRIDRNYICSAAKVFPDGKPYPAFAIYDIDGKGVARWGINGNGTQTKPYKVDSLLAEQHFVGTPWGDHHQRIMRSSGRDWTLIDTYHKFSGVIPDSAREKVKALRACGEAVKQIPEIKTPEQVSDSKWEMRVEPAHEAPDKIFLIEEAYAWSKPEVRNLDPIIVLEHGDVWYLVDKFDVTPLEQWLVQEAVG
jgi:hypothetical protein